jgi:hypothetical protein
MRVNIVFKELFNYYWVSRKPPEYVYDVGLDNKIKVWNGTDVGIIITIREDTWGKRLVPQKDGSIVERSDYIDKKILLTDTVTVKELLVWYCNQTFSKVDDRTIQRYGFLIFPKNALKGYRFLNDEEIVNNFKFMKIQHR